MQLVLLAIAGVLSRLLLMLQLAADDILVPLEASVTLSAESARHVWYWELCLDGAERSVLETMALLKG